uniref:Ig-like domain-containing protein n=1 Tax=Amphiprion percula TaxID=161767 RepID=A0A3P8RYA2_AMPPE
MRLHLGILFLSFFLCLCSGCIDDQNFVTQTVGVGQNVTLTCTRQTSLYQQPTLHWIRLVSGKSPEFLGGTHTFDYHGVNKTPHITTKQGPGTFILQIHETQLNDSGFYYCIKVKRLNMEFMNTTFLKVKVPPSDPEHPGDPMTLQCSVLSDSEKKTCPEQQHRVFWFRSGSDESHPRLIYADGNSQDECETNPEAQSPQKCIYSFSKTVTSSDAGTYYCAVATCGQILFGNGTKLDNKGNYKTFFTYWLNNISLFLVSAALATSLIVIAFLIYFIKTKTCEFCNYHLPAQISYFKIQLRIFPQRNEDSLVYSAPAFNKRKAERRNAKTSQEETIYTDVNTSARN